MNEDRVKVKNVHPAGMDLEVPLLRRLLRPWKHGEVFWLTRADADSLLRQGDNFVVADPDEPAAEPVTELPRPRGFLLVSWRRSGCRCRLLDGYLSTEGWEVWLYRYHRTTTQPLRMRLPRDEMAWSGPVAEVLRGAQSVEKNLLVNCHHSGDSPVDLDLLVDDVREVSRTRKPRSRLLEVDAIPKWGKSMRGFRSGMVSSSGESFEVWKPSPPRT